jgi:oligoendopeptidase F
MFKNLPTDPQAFIDWTWANYETYYRDLETRSLDSNTVAQWLADWTSISQRFSESYSRLHVATTLNTTDAEAEQRYHAFIGNVVPAIEAADQKLKLKLLLSQLQPIGFEIPLRNMRAEADLFRAENLPLLTENRKLGSEYNKIIGAQSIQWNGEEITLQQVRPIIQNSDRATREKAWRAAADRQLASRSAINELWVKLMNVRGQIPRANGLPNFLEYKWRELLRFDYSPADSETFQRAIESVAVPAATRIYNKMRDRLDAKTLRPWDLDLDLYPISYPPLKPYTSIDELLDKPSAIFHHVDPQLGEYYDIMRREQLIDPSNYKGKAPGAYCTEYTVQKRPFVFLNSVGVRDDVRTLLHECGHAFHVFETNYLPYIHQLQVTMEFAEVASMGMELLAGPYLSKRNGGFYSEADATHDRIDHLERIILFWPYMAVVDAFQHWVYTHIEEATDANNCDRKWAELWRRFIPSVDWSGLEDSMMTGWHRKQHIHRAPLYYVEYGLAQLGAVQVWRNALKDQAGAVKSYRQALSLGATVPLPELYKAAGAKFAFDARTLGEAVDLIESQIVRLEKNKA